MTDLEIAIYSVDWCANRAPKGGRLDMSQAEAKLVIDEIKRLQAFEKIVNGSIACADRGVPVNLTQGLCR